MSWYGYRRDGETRQRFNLDKISLKSGDKSNYSKIRIPVFSNVHEPNLINEAV